MPNEVDQSILDRLQALRGASPASKQQPGKQPSHTSPKIDVDVIQRNKTPTREDSLADRLKSLRQNDELGNAPSSPSSTRAEAATPQASPAPARAGRPVVTDDDYDDDVDAAFQTDDQTLEELLGDIPETDEDAKVRALLEELEDSIPHDDKARDDDADSDDSEGPGFKKEVDDVIARFRDELQVSEAASDKPEEQSEQPDDESSTAPPDLPSLPDLPSVPGLPSAPTTSLDDISARLSALRTQDDLLPSVPTSRPSKEPRRLTSRTGYTDDDVDSWCTVCLEDATLICLGCENEDEGKQGDPYCTRCWREMHVGPASAFDDRTHRAVQITRAKKDQRDKVALGA